MELRESSELMLLCPQHNYITSLSQRDFCVVPTDKTLQHKAGSFWFVSPDACMVCGSQASTLSATPSVYVHPQVTRECAVAWMGRSPELDFP